MTTAEKWSLVIQAAAAVGSLVVAVLAIWGDFIRSKLAAPRLSLRLRDQYGEPTKFGDGRPVRYYHLVVSNSRKWAPARNVLVYLTHVEKPGPDDNWQPAMVTGPVPLNWQFAARYRPGLPSIGPDRICDLGRVGKGESFELTPQFLPNNLDPQLPAGQKLRAHVIADAENSRSPELIVEVAWDGKWEDGATEMASHLVIREVRQTTS